MKNDLTTVGAVEEGTVPQLLVLLHQEDHVAQVNALSPRAHCHWCAYFIALVKFEFLGFGSADGGQGGCVSF